MNKKAQLELLDQTVDRLRGMGLVNRHIVLVGLLAWHVSSAPAGQKEKVLMMMSGQALELLSAARKRNKNEASDLRH